ncbi:SRPBCC family protein [Roseicyclus sp.]|uniref:SRPBCC family protein n=1 Tax=Roseicyclus sp. TaxID=1914329 RepID=UPI003FA16F4F
MRKISLTALLPAPPERVRALVMRPATLVHVSRPLLTFRPLPGPFPEVWAEGEHEVAMRFLGVLPLGRQTIRIRFEARGDGAFRVRDAGGGQLARTWDHLITIAPEGTGTRYTDEVTIEAGPLTGAVALFARLFCAHRQRRWRSLLARGETPRG